MHPIIESVGIKNLPGSESELVKKILNDHLVCVRAQELMVEHFAAEAIRRMNPLEHDALVKRVSPAPKVVQSTVVNWSVRKTHSGEWHIFCTGPHRDMGDGTSAPSGTMRFTGAPDDAKTFRFMGATVPAEIIEEYRRNYRGPLWSLEKP
jgi:hypothetical protein